MYTPTILVCLALAVPSTLANGGGFCYQEADGCGPKSAEWTGQCNTGKSQSPIRLPPVAVPTGATPMKLSAYRGSYFRMQNNGHSVAVDFDGQGPHQGTLAFPDPEGVKGIYSTMQGQQQYKFSSAHFHWGPNDTAQGSEHCIGMFCAQMEMHLVHYNAKYASQADAVASGDKNALAVLGLLISHNLIKDMVNSAMNLLPPRQQDMGIGALAPIANNIHSVVHADHDTTKWTKVNQPLDLSKMLISAAKLGMYSYKGSLTTPGCNEQVNWFVLKQMATQTKQDIAAFRKIQDGRGKVLTDNHRPLQDQNGRPIFLTSIITY